MTGSGPSFTVVIAGDEALRQRVEPLLADRDALLVIGSVDADQALATAVGRAPDVVVVAEHPGSGLTAPVVAAQIGAALPATRVLVVTQGAPAAEPAALLDAWVGGVVDLDTGPSLADAVEWLALGEGIVDAGLAAAVLERHHTGAAAGTGVEPLTATEEEVLTRLAAGAEVETLASEYAVSPRLVRQHAGGALARLHPRI